MIDVLVVSLGSTGGLRTADDALVDSLSRAGVDVRMVSAKRAPEVRTLALTDLVWALAARRAATAGIEEWDPRVVVYSSVGAVLLWPRQGVIRFDATPDGNRPGRHGVWQRPVGRRRLASSPLLMPWSEDSLEGRRVATPSVTVPVPIAWSGGAAERDISVVSYGANPEKKGIDRILAAWRSARRPGETLVIGGLDGMDEEGVRYAGVVPSQAWGELVARARVFVAAPRREDYGIAQLEALAAGCMLVTTPGPGPYAALPLARELDPRLVTDDLAPAIRTALDDPAPGYAARARALLAPFAPEAVDRIIRDELLPRLAQLGVCTPR